MTDRPLEGIRVLEVASWMFIPAAGAVLADWGADVIKIEHPDTGDPQRGLVTSGLLPGGADGVNFMMEQPNRSKRSVTIDLAHPEGHGVFLRLVEQADVVLTNYLPAAVAKLRIGVDDLRAANPNVIVARGTGQGSKGPDADKGGYDAASFWARGGVGVSMPDSDGWPPGQPTPAFGDVVGGLATAGAIAAALLKRERTGEPSVVEVSLLATAMWQVSPMVIASKLYGFDKISGQGRSMSPNVGVGTYRTGDGRHLMMMLLQSDRYWADFVTRLGLEDMATDERFATDAARQANQAACLERLDAAFAEHPLSYWREALAEFKGVWSPFQTLNELYEDPQVVANGYLPTMTAANGSDVALVASPAQFDGEPIRVQRCPEHGEHTELALIEAGYDWDELTRLKESGAIG